VEVSQKLLTLLFQLSHTLRKPIRKALRHIDSILRKPSMSFLASVGEETLPLSNAIIQTLVCGLGDNMETVNINNEAAHIVLAMAITALEEKTGKHIPKEFFTSTGDYQIDLKINGYEFPLVPLLEEVSKITDGMVEKAACKLIEERARNLSDRLQTLEDRVKDELAILFP
jgi:hypothetical protein